MASWRRHVPFTTCFLLFFLLVKSFSWFHKGKNIKGRLLGQVRLFSHQKYENKNFFFIKNIFLKQNEDPFLQINIFLNEHFSKAKSHRHCSENTTEFWVFQFENVIQKSKREELIFTAFTIPLHIANKHITAKFFRLPGLIVSFNKIFPFNFKGRMFVFTSTGLKKKHAKNLYNSRFLFLKVSPKNWSPLIMHPVLL